MNIGILGTGAYGLSLSSVILKNAKHLMMWTKFEDEKELLLKERENTKLLPGYKLDEKIEITTDLEKIIKYSDLLIVVIPAAFIDDLCKQMTEFITEKNHICIASKGIEQNTGLFIHEIVEKYIDTSQIAVISGPTFAVDLIENSPCGLSLATKNELTQKIVRDAFKNTHVCLKENDDIIGVATSGALKNVLAIASGILEGLEAKDSTKAMFFTNVILDMQELIQILGGKKESILTYSGFGDLLLTCTSPKSRNYTYGKLIGKGNLEDIKNYEKSTTIEGLYTLEAIYKILNDKNIKIPIIDLIYDIVINKDLPEKLLTYLIEK